jgi:hypothetical protein
VTSGHGCHPARTGYRPFQQNAAREEVVTVAENFVEAPDIVPPPHEQAEIKPSVPVKLV